MNILITGGASGLGKAITKLLATNENKVVFTYNSSIEKAKEIEAEFPSTIAIQCDFRNTEDVSRLMEIISEYGINILINNAYFGEPITKHFHKIPIEEFSKRFIENIIPTIKITQAAIAYFRKEKYGKIINILTSFLINKPPAGSSVYVANKAYIEELSKSWAAENAIYNITSNSVSPSFMQTNFTNDVDERLIDNMISNHPLKKILTVEEVAESVEFFVKASQQINGVNLIINAASDFK